MIKLENVTYRYKKNNNVLNNINLTIKDKETIAIVGKNGSGKSTLGKLIAGIIKPKEGNIFIDNLNITDKNNKENIRKKMGIVFQNPDNQIIFNNLEDELSFALKDLSKEEIKKRIETSLQKVHLDKNINKDLYELSLGQKQRVVIAEVLAKQPKYLIFDEPTTMIDSSGKEKIYKIIEELKTEGYTIVYITNVAEEILLADRIIVLEEGKVAEEIEKKDLFTKFETLEKYDIKIPFLFELIQLLKKEGISINLENYSINEFVAKIKELINK